MTRSWTAATSPSWTPSTRPARRFISSTKLDGRVVLRVAIGNERTTRDDVRAVWELLRTTAVEVFPGATR